MVCLQVLSYATLTETYICEPDRGNWDEPDTYPIDEFLNNNKSYVASFDKGSLPMPPAKHIAVVACMDARLETGVLLGLVKGDAHVIRNAGGVVTDDVIRSLAISQRLLATRAIMLFAQNGA